MSNLDTLQDLGDGLAGLYAATIGRVGHDDPAALLVELVDELTRLSDLASARLWVPDSVTGAEDETQALRFLLALNARIDRYVLALNDMMRVCNCDFDFLLSRLLPDLLNVTCKCLSWGVTR